MFKYTIDKLNDLIPKIMSRDTLTTKPTWCSKILSETIKSS